MLSSRFSCRGTGGAAGIRTTDIPGYGFTLRSTATCTPNHWRLPTGPHWSTCTASQTPRVAGSSGRRGQSLSSAARDMRGTVRRCDTSLPISSQITPFGDTGTGVVMPLLASQRAAGAALR
jgi:hypothetical protein